MAITLNQIAEICGVSRGTVDRALHNKGNVRPAVAERIKAAKLPCEVLAIGTNAIATWHCPAHRIRFASA